MAYTVEQLTAIESAIASGQLKVAFQGREVVYRSMDDLLKAHSFIKNSLQQSGALTKKRKHSYISKGAY